jgi:hypothetical protein
MRATGRFGRVADRPWAVRVAEKWIEKFKGKFDEGWDKYREHTLAQQKKLGVVPKDTKASA